MLVAGVVFSVAVTSNRLSTRLRVPAPGIFLLCAALVTSYVPGLRDVVGIETVERVVTVALALILFDGGMHIGLRRFRDAITPILSLGIVATFATTAATAALAHLLFGFSWPIAFVIGAAVAPTDPAVVFSVLGPREVVGRSGTILEGESGANDPAGIALMIGVIGFATSRHGSVADVAAEFVEQMAIGAAVGVVGGYLLIRLLQRVPLPNEGLYPLRTVGAALTLYGVASVAHGSGFLAVLVAGIMLGDESAPYKGEIKSFHSSIASLAEVTAFVLLGLTIHLEKLTAGNAWWIGLVLAVLLIVVVRPAVTLPLLAMVKLRPGERAFVAFAGLKGAVPILLGALAVTGGVSDATRVYAVIFVVVAFSVFVQGGSIPYAARLCGVHMRLLAPEPWSLGVRFQEEPSQARRYVVGQGTKADGATANELPFGDDVWVSLVIRQGRLVQMRGDEALKAGDEVLLLAGDDPRPDVEAFFRERPG